MKQEVINKFKGNTERSLDTNVKCHNTASKKPVQSAVTSDQVTNHEAFIVCLGYSLFSSHFSHLRGRGEQESDLKMEETARGSC